MLSFQTIDKISPYYLQPTTYYTATTTTNTTTLFLFNQPIFTDITPRFPKAPPKNHLWELLVGCPSCHPTDSVKVLHRQNISPY